MKAERSRRALARGANIAVRGTAPLSAGTPPSPRAIPAAIWDDHPQAAELARLDAACFSPAWDADTYAEGLKRPDRRCWVLRTGTPALSVGFVACQRVEREAEVLRLGIVPGRRERGWGRRLLAGVLARLAKEGVRRVFLEVREGNRPAVALYRGAGFREVGRRPNYYASPPEDALLLARNLGRRP
jgi:[ribosomal protein S18]-alanine N-acetyltransferase